jgi:hypothetical protein
LVGGGTPTNGKIDDGLFEGLGKEFCSDRSVKAFLRKAVEKAKAYITEKAGNQIKSPLDHLDLGDMGDRRNDSDTE